MIKEPDYRKTEAYNQGATACTIFSDSRWNDKRENPYDIHSIEHHYWNMGWKENNYGTTYKYRPS